MKRLFQVMLLIGVFSLASCAAHYKERPHGWDHGKKKGWGGANVPPGHQKKSGGGDDINININIDVDGDDDLPPGQKKKKNKGNKGNKGY